jgi:hypothetical protein
MTYGIFSMESGSALAWCESMDDAIGTVRAITEGEPDALEVVSITTFSDTGEPGEVLHGAELVEAMRGSVAA